MGWISSFAKQKYLESWNEYFTTNSSVRAETLSGATGIAPEIIEGVRLASKTLNFTRLWKNKLKKIVEGIPIQESLKRESKDLVRLMYYAMYLSLRYQQIKGPVLDDWLLVIRSYVNGKERRVRYYPPSENILGEKFKDVSIRRQVLLNEIRSCKKDKKFKALFSKQKKNIEFVVVNTIYFLLQHIQNPKSRKLYPLLAATIKGVVEAYGRDVVAKKIGKSTITFLNGYANRVAFEEGKHLTQTNTMVYN